MEITKNSIIGDVLDQYPDVADIFFDESCYTQVELLRTHE